VVLADGRVVDCDERRDAELFWALRGAGGGNFGVATSLTFRTVPAPSATSFHLVWPATEAVALIDAWQAWAPAGPDELAASLLVTASGDLDRPAEVNLFGAMLASEAESTKLLDELVVRAGADPPSASWVHLPYRETKRHLAEHGPGGEPPPDAHAFSKSEFFGRPLPRDAIAALVEQFTRDRAAGEWRELDFTPWGGAYNRIAPEATAFCHRDALFLLKHAVVVEPDASAVQRDAAGRWLARSWESVRPWGTGGVYPNFPDPELEDWAHAYYGDNYARLRDVKRIYDPDNFFRFSQSIG